MPSTRSVDIPGRREREDRSGNPKRRVSRFIAVTTGLLLCAIGVLHVIVNIRLANRAIVRGEIVERLGAMLIANATVSGVALVLLGSFLLIVAPALHKGKRLAWRLAFAIGMFLIISGLVGYWWQPVPAVLIFSALGLALTSPLLLWREHYVAE